MCCHAAIFRPTFEKYKSDIRNTWKTIKEILSKRGNKNASPTYLNVNGIEIINTLEIANMFNTFFYKHRSWPS